MAKDKPVRKNINFPSDLITRIYKLTKNTNVDFSKFVREATEEYVTHLERARLEKELEEGYKAKAGLNLGICDDFKHSDGENL